MSIPASAVFFLGVVLLSGCAARLEAYQGADAGVAFATIAAKSGTEYSSYRLLFRSRAEKAEGEFVWLQNNWFSSDKPDFSDATKTGEVLPVKLAPGEYELYSVSTFQNGYPATMTWSPREPFSIPFTVRTGQATYLGEFLAIATFGENVFGATVRGGPIFVVSDQRARDEPIARAEIGGFSTVQSASPRGNALPPPLFGATPPGL